VALAIEFSDHILVLESGQSEARGQAVLAEARKVIPNKPIRYVVNTHAHFDHASGLAAVVADGIPIITQNDNKAFFEKALSAPRTLVGDSLSKTGKKPVIEGVAEKRELKDATRTVELYHVQGLAHTDGMLVAYLPNEKILFTADFNVPAMGQPASPFITSLVQNVDRRKLDFEMHVLVNAPNGQTADPGRLMALAKTVLPRPSRGSPFITKSRRLRRSRSSFLKEKASWSSCPSFFVMNCLLQWGREV
jgi:glyoxylase-like metal-dependent hydrolase (beta-lactamase superfamily II)